MSQSRFVVTLAAGVLFVGMALSGPKAIAQSATSADPVIVMETAKGTIEITTYPDDAPKSLAHVLALVRRGFYRGLRFHWVSAGSIQFGDPTTRDMTKQDVWGMGGSGQPVGVAETSKRKFERGTVGLAYDKGAAPRTADSQLFIIRIANSALDGKYAVIGHVTSGMNVVDKIDKADVIRRVYVKGEAPK